MRWSAGRSLAEFSPHQQQHGDQGDDGEIEGSNARGRPCHPTTQTPEVNGGPRRFVDAAPTLHKAALAAGDVTRMTVVQWKL
jgi:hypothetical protein